MARARYLCMVRSPEQQIFCRETTDRRDNSFIGQNCVRIAAPGAKNTHWMPPQTFPAEEAKRLSHRETEARSSGCDTLLKKY
jgi:hypothetical protein